MKKPFVVLIIVLVSSISGYCQHPYKQDLRGIATITFPDTPKSKTVSSDATEYYTNYNNSIYFAICSPLSRDFKDLLDENNIDSLYNSYVTAVIKSSHGHSIFKNKTKFNNLDGVEFCFTSSFNRRVFYNYSRVVYLNKALIGYSYVSPDSLKSDDKQIVDYFNTFKLTIKKDDVMQRNDLEIADDLGHLVGHSILIIVPILLGLGIIFIIRKLAYKK